jgi:phospholipase C
VRHLFISLCIAATLCGCAQTTTQAVTPVARPAIAKRSITSVSHVVILEMENRSLDEMFGTYPGVNGVNSPGVVCNPDPSSGQCILPFHDTSTINHGGPHSDAAERVDIDGGKMDGFIASARDKAVMGYHTCDEIPTYCFYAQNGVLADNFFEASSSFSTMAHLYMVSNWSAKCTGTDQPLSCVSDNEVAIKSKPDLAWTDMTYLFHKAGISWGYFVFASGHPFIPPQDNDGEVDSGNSFKTAGLWNPLPDFDTVKEDGETANIRPGYKFDALAVAGTLPQVSWVVPSFNTSDHPSADLVQGQLWVKHEIDEIEAGADGPSTLIIINWDDFGGFYDHVQPPFVDALGYGIRTPMILYGPMVAAPGSVDHQFLSTDAVNAFIERLFLSGQMLDPNTDGRPDSRPDVREMTPGLGAIENDLNG